MIAMLYRNPLIIVTSFVLALLLNILPLPEWALSLRPPWATLVLIYWCIAMPERIGVGIGWSLGIILDVLTGTLLGQHALGLSVVAYLANKLCLRIRIFPLWQQALTVLMMLLADRLLALWTMGLSGRPAPSLWYWLPPIIGALLWPWLFIILRDLRRNFSLS